MWLVVRNPFPFGEELTETYFACAPPHGRTRVVATAGSFAQCASSVTFKTAGSLLLTREFGGCSVGWSETLILHDLRHERTTEIIAYSGANFGLTQVPGSLQPLGAPFGLSAGEFALNANGDVAWAGSSAPGEVRQRVLYVRDTAGTRRVAAAPDLSHIAFSGGELTWKAAHAMHAVPA